MTTQILPIILPLSASPIILGQTADQILAALGPIDIIDADVTEPQDAPGQPSRTLLITYSTPGATLYRSVCFGDDTPDGDAAAADLFFQNYPSKTGIRMFDLSDLNLGKLRRGRTLVLLTDAAWYGTPIPGQQQLFIVRASAAIAAGASGLAVPLYGDLTTGTALTVRNPTPYAASDASLGYCFLDPVSGDYLLFPTCCGGLSLLSGEFGAPGFPPGTTYASIIPLGTIADATLDCRMQFSAPITMTTASSSTSGGSLVSGPTLESGDTVVRWVFNNDSDNFIVTIEGAPPAGIPFAVGGGGEYPETGTNFTVSVFVLGPLTGDQTLTVGDPLDIAPVPLPTFSESSIGSVEWYKDGSPTGVTTWTYHIDNVVLGDAGSYDLYINGSSYSSYSLGPPCVVTVNP